MTKMNLFFWRKKKQQDDNDLILRLHRGLQAANKENTVLYKKYKEKLRTLENQVEWLQERLCELAIERDDWQEKYVDLLESVKEDNHGEQKT